MRAQQVCARGFAETHPDDAARLIEQHPAPESAGFLEKLSAAAAAGVIERMGPAASAACLASMSPERAAVIVSALSPRVAAALLRRLAAVQRDALLSILPSNTKDGILRLLSYAEDSIGFITDPGVLGVPQDLSAGEALRQLRKHHGAAHHHVYVVDRTQRLVGVVHIRDLVGSPSKRPLADIMGPAHASLTATSRLATAVDHPAWRQLDTLPVTDQSGTLLGMVRHRQLRHLDSVPRAGGIVDTLLGLGELYWVGLSTFLPSGPSDSVARAPTSESSKEGHHHA